MTKEELILEKIAKEGFKPIPTEKHIKMLEEQRILNLQHLCLPILLNCL